MRRFALPFAGFLLVLVWASSVAAGPARLESAGGLLQRVPGLRVNRLSTQVITDDIGIRHFVGIGVNRSTKNVMGVQINVRLLDRQGRELQVIPAPPLCVWFVRPGDSFPFDVPIIAPRPIGRIEAFVTGIPTDRPGMVGVVLDQAKWRLEPPGSPLAGFVYIEGLIRNRSNVNYYFPEACGAALNRRGKVIVAGQAPTTTQQLPPRQINGFSGDIGSYPALQPVAGVRIWLKVCREDDVLDGLCGG